MPLLLTSGVAVVIALVLTASSLRIGKSSGPYWQSIDRSYGHQAALIVNHSNVLGRQVDALVSNPAADTRVTLDAALAYATKCAHEELISALQADQLGPQGHVAMLFGEVISERLQAVGVLNSVIDRLLDMTPPSIVDAPAQKTTVNLSPLTVSGAESELGKAGVVLLSADALYQKVRNELGNEPGHFWLPGSSWTTHSKTWTTSTIGAAVGALVGTKDLQPSVDVVLVPGTTSLSPAALPSSTSVDSVIPPTHSLSVGVVVSEAGTLSTKGFTVTVALTTAPSDKTVQRHMHLSLGPHGSKALEFRHLRVKPGRTYDVAVTVTVPAGQSAMANTGETFSVSVAPNSLKAG